MCRFLKCFVLLAYSIKSDFLVSAIARVLMDCSLETLTVHFYPRITRVILPGVTEVNSE